MWGGLKGAVPILLGALAVLSNVDDARRIYELIFVVVAFSVVVQGSTVPWAARRLGVRMRMRSPEPWRLTIDLPKEPGDLLPPPCPSGLLRRRPDDQGAAARRVRLDRDDRPRRRSRAPWRLVRAPSPATRSSSRPSSTTSAGVRRLFEGS